MSLLLYLFSHLWFYILNCIYLQCLSWKQMQLQDCNHYICLPYFTLSIFWYCLGVTHHCTYLLLKFLPECVLWLTESLTCNIAVTATWKWINGNSSSEVFWFKLSGKQDIWKIMKESEQNCYLMALSGMGRNTEWVIYWYKTVWQVH